MTQNESTSPEATAPTEPGDQRHPALARLERLVGTWDLRWRMLGSTEDNITGVVTIDWLPGGFFLQQRGEFDLMGAPFFTLEILRYDPETDSFPSAVYSNTDDKPGYATWNVRGDVVTQAMPGATYSGTFSEDGSTVVGDLLPDDGVERTPENTYSTIMIRRA